MADGELVAKAKLYAAIDLKSLEHAYLNGGLPGGLQEFTQVQQGILAFLNDDTITDEDILNASNGDLSGMDGLFSKIGNAIKNVAEKIGKGAKDLVTKVIPNAAKTAVKVVTTPIRFISGLSITLVMKALKGKSTRAFFYALIPSDSSYLDQNPKVKAKRDKAVKVLEIVAKSTTMSPTYFKKIIRNNTIDHYKKTPEQLIKMLSEGKDVDGLGLAVSSAVAIITALAPIAAALVAAKYGKEDIPDVGDWVRSLPAKLNLTGEPLPNGIDPKDTIKNFQDFVNGETDIPLTEKATEAAGKVATWMSIISGGVGVVSAVRK